MGLLFSHLWRRLFSHHQFKICVVGLDNAGKTTILFQLHCGEVVETQPTIGSNVEEVIHKNIRFTVWDLGGQESLRTTWSTYYQGTHAVLMVIDSTDSKRLSTVKMELFKLLACDELSSSVLLVFANKQDCAGAMSSAEIAEELNLQAVKNHDWHIQACCALTGEGLYEGIETITQKVTAVK